MKKIIQNLLLLSTILIVSLNLIGCSTKRVNNIVETHPITNEDILTIKKGTVIVFVDGRQVIVMKDGRFLSEDYLEHIFKVKAGL